MLAFRGALETEANQDNYGERPITPLVPHLTGESVVTVTADAADRSNTTQSYPSFFIIRSTRLIFMYQAKSGLLKQGLLAILAMFCRLPWTNLFSCSLVSLLWRFCRCRHRGGGGARFR